MAKHHQKRKRGRVVNGLFLLDKPQGITSNGALQQVKRLFGAAKAGHTGSLDPLATGMLPICFGEATKFSQYLLDADKVYRTTAKLGVRTASGDSESEVLETRPVEFSRVDIDKALAGFRGEIEQVPSMYSALKHNGQPLYKLARQGLKVERKARTVHIYDIELLDMQGDEVTLELRCSKGTYVRSLVDDLGEDLGCGAHVIALRRLCVSGFDGAAMHSLDELEQVNAEQKDFLLRNDSMDAWLLPLEEVVAGLPEIELSDLMTHYVRQGQPVFVPNNQLRGQVVLFNKEASKGKKFLGIGEIMDDGRVTPRRLITTG